MNRDCNGDFFTADGIRYYRCLLDSAVITAPQNNDLCPNCSRVIDAEDIGELPVRTVRVVKIPSGSEIQLPEFINSKKI